MAQLLTYLEAKKQSEKRAPETASPVAASIGKNRRRINE